MIAEGLIRQVALKLGGKWAGNFLREVADGTKGPGLQKTYLWLQGKKTAIGVLMAGICAVMIALGTESYLSWVAGLATFLVTVGLADKAWRSVPQSWLGANWYRVLRNNWADVVTLLGGVAASMTTCSPETAAFLGKFGLTCGTGILVITGVLAFGGWLVGEAKLAEAPSK